MYLQHRKSRMSSMRILWTIALVSIGCAFAFERALAQSQMCLPQVTGLPVKTGSTYTFPNNPPVIPSSTCTSLTCPAQPEADTGWFNAFLYTVETGTNVPNMPSDGAFQAIQQGSKLYFSFEINGESGTPNLYDTVILAFVNYPPAGPAPASPVYTWIVISGPFNATPSFLPQAVPPTNISVWQGTSADPTTWSGPVTGPIAWLSAGMSGVTAGSSYNWWVVVSIDNSAATGPQLPTSGQFGIFMDAIRSDLSTFVDNQSTFNLPFLPVTTNPDPGNPAPSKWANATLASSGCSGVFINSFDITNTILGSPTDNLSYTNANNFQVRVHNSGVDAPQVTATFRIADFGLPAPNNWQVLGFDVCGVSPLPAGCPPSHIGDSVANNPSSTGTDVPAAVSTPTGSCADGTGNGCSTISAGGWTLGTSNAAFYQYDDNQHQCVRADLNSLAGTTTFINNSAWNNFEFSGSASNFRGPAKVSADYPVVGTSGQQTFHLKVAATPMNAEGAHKVFASSGRSVLGPAAGTVSNYLSFIVDGCRLSGGTLKIPKRNSDGRQTRDFVTLQNCDSVGSYGYLIRHDGPVDTWNHSLAASGSGVSLTVSPTDANSYTLVIPQGKTAEVVTNVNPATGGGTGVIPNCWWIILLLILLIIYLLMRRRKHA
jgi:hypothetical protein